MTTLVRLDTVSEGQATALWGPKLIVAEQALCSPILSNSVENTSDNIREVCFGWIRDRVVVVECWNLLDLLGEYMKSLLQGPFRLP